MLKLVLITDKSFTLPLLQMFLEKLGYSNFQFVETKEDYLKICSQHSFDLVIIDSFSIFFDDFLKINKTPFLTISDTNFDKKSLNLEKFLGIIKRPLNLNQLKKILNSAENKLKQNK